MFKNIYKISLLTTLLALCSIAESLGQSGNMYITHVVPNINVSNVNFEILQDSRGILNIANKNGILQYDASTWNLVETSGSILTLVQFEEIIYAAGRSGFGKVVLTDNYESKYISLSDSLDWAINFFASERFEDKIYFLNSSVLVEYDVKNQNISRFEIAGEPLNLFVINEKLVVETGQKGYYVLSNNVLVEFNTPGSINIDFVATHSGTGSSMLADDQNHLYLLNGDSPPVPLFFADSLYLEENEITSMLWVGADRLAVATLTGGLLVLDVNSMQGQIIDYFSGLPDNEVFALGLDLDAGLWTAHSGGFSRIALDFPFREFSNYSGLEGSLLSIAEYENRLYIGTSIGLFVLDEIKDFQTLTSYVRRVTNLGSKAETEATKKERKGILGLFKKKSSTKNKTTPRPSVTYVKQTSKELVSIRHEFQKLAPINSKVVQLISNDEGLFASTLEGLFQIKDTAASRILDEPMRFALASNQWLFGSTVNDHLRVFRKSGEGWLESDLLEGLDDYVQQIAFDGMSNYWLCSADSIYKIDIQNKELYDVQVFAINNPFLDDTYATFINGKTQFVNTSGFYYYDENLLQIVPDDSLNSEHGSPNQYFLGNEGSIWFQSGDAWRNSHTAESNILNINLLPYVTAVANTDSSIFWALANNKIFKFTHPIGQVKNNHELILKEAKSAKESLPPNAGVTIEQKDASISFKFVQPDYSGTLGLKYRYQLDEIQKEWSPWSSGTINIAFPFLPPGIYNLNVETMDAFGHSYDTPSYAFQVIPPYWETWWFYTLEVIFFGGLMILSIVLNRGGKLQLLSRLLAFMTLIMILELIQTIGENTFDTDESPVLNFFIHVLIAMLMIPFEQKVRTSILKKQST